MKRIGITVLGLLLGLMLLVLTGCDAFDTSNDFSSSVNATQSDASLPGGLSKAYSEAALATVMDPGGNVYTATYLPNASGYDENSNKTTFAYAVDVTNTSGFHFALQVPECAYQAFDGSVPTGNWNGNANGSLEFGPEDFSSGTTNVSVVFNGNVGLGVIFASFKYGGSGDTPEQQPIFGPCQQADYFITGTVFLDDKSDPNGTYGDQDPNEPGIGGVQVTLTDAEGATMTAFTGADGSYLFHVLGPPVFDGHYTVEVLSDGAGLNAQLFDLDGFWKLSDTATREVDLDSSSVAAPIGFYLDIDKAVQVFEDPTRSETDMLEWEFWKVQVFERGTRKYKPVVGLDTLDAYMGVINSFSDNIEPVFGPGGVDLTVAQEVLKTSSKSNAQGELKTLALAALFNFAAGRGACGPDDISLVDPNPDYPAFDPINFPVCAQLDTETTRLIIEQALVEWMRIEGVGPTTSKESGGSMGRVLSAMMD